MNLFALQEGNASSLLIDQLLDYGITYCSITLLNPTGEAIFSKSSSEKWHTKYIESDLYKKCHLMNEASYQIKNQKNGFIFVWDKYFPVNEESEYLNKLRIENNFDHGVAFCSSINNECKSILTVTGKHHDINFSKLVLKNKNPLYKAVMKSLINV